MLPVDQSFRPFRYTWLAEALVRAGHRVVRWAPTFAHALKTHRSEDDMRVEVFPGYTLELLKTSGYESHVGLRRLWFSVAFAHRLAEVLPRAPRPDLIVAAIPAPESVWVAARYAARTKVPLVVDVRDLWPDVLLQALPASLRRPMAPSLFPWRVMNRQALRTARAITGVSESYLEWGLRAAGRARREMDRAFPIGNEEVAIAGKPDAEVMKALADAGVNGEGTVCVFAGQFERSYDLATTITAARILRENGREDIRFVFCGDGGDNEILRRQGRGLDNVIFTGWVGKPTINAIIRMSAVGLASYRAGALQSVPNKVAEYLAGGLAVASSLEGEFATTVTESDCGFNYKAGDPRDLADRLRALADDPQRMAQLRGNARALYQRQFQVAAIYPEMVRHLERVTAA